MDVYGDDHFFVFPCLGSRYGLDVPRGIQSQQKLYRVGPRLGRESVFNLDPDAVLIYGGVKGL